MNNNEVKVKNIMWCFKTGKDTEDIYTT